jgi:hypothetical protein
MADQPKPKLHGNGAVQHPPAVHPAYSGTLKVAPNVEQGLGKPPHALKTEEAYAHPHA